MCTINHEKKVIFINIPKTGRTYVNEVLCKYYNFEDFTSVKRPDHEEYLNINKINKLMDVNENKNFSIIDYFKTSPELNKITNMDEEKWKTYFKFTFIREPLQRLVSGYNYINSRKNNNLIEFKKFIRQKKVSDFTFVHCFANQYNFICSNGKIIIDYIGDFDNLNNDLNYILLKLGFELKNHPMEKINKSINCVSNKYYNINDIDYVKKMFFNDFILYSDLITRSKI